MLKLGVLDFGDFDNVFHFAHDKINELFEIVPLIEKLGFKRYWLGEHHSPFHAWGSPEILIPLMAGITDRIKIGSAGIQIMAHSPLRIAQTFKLIESIYPGRIDLGIAKGQPQDIFLKALLDIETVDLVSKMEYDRKLNDLICFLYEKFEESNPLGEIKLHPIGATVPDVWLLGSSENSFIDAVKYDTNFCLSLFHGRPANDPNILRKFSDYSNRVNNKNTNFTLCVSGLCTENNKQTKKVRKDPRFNNAILNVVGTQEECKNQLYELQYRYKVDEIEFLDIGINFEERVNNYKLLAETFNLSSSIKGN